METAYGVRLAVRLGIHTGTVVVGEMGGGDRHENLALGETPNIAARLEGLASPNGVVISDATYQLVEGYFVCEALGEQSLKGLAQPLNVYRVVQESGVQSRLDVALTRGLTPLVGRDTEVTLLLERWRQVEDESGQVVLIRGEAGIGKSRLIQAVKEHVASVSHTWLECRGSPYFQNTALYPIMDLLQRIFQWEPDDDAEEKLAKLEQALDRYPLSLQEIVLLLATLLSLPLPEDRYVPLTFTPEQLRQKTLETLVTTLMAQAKHQPVFCIVEDVHWTDPTTLEFLDLLMDQSRTTALFTLLTCRLEFESTWSRRSHFTEVSLTRLSQPHMEQIAERVANGKRLPDEVMRELIEKTDGVPLYLEELTKTVIESGALKEHAEHYELTGSIASLAIPTTLHDSLMSRLDRLTSAKGVAQLGATIGRTFSYELLEVLTSLDTPALQWELHRLVEAELVFQRGIPPQSTYTFKHALVQDAAYQSQLKRTRQQVHQQIVQIVEEAFPEVVERHPELLAHHGTEAGQDEQAIGYWRQAGQRAVEQSAYAEAVSHLTKGLELLRTRPDTPARLHQELVLLTSLGPALLVTKGATAVEVEQTYTQAWELCQRVEAGPQLLRVLWGLRLLYTGQGSL